MKARTSGFLPLPSFSTTTILSFFSLPNSQRALLFGIPDILIKQAKNSLDKESPESSIRERDLKGHIKSSKENGEAKEVLPKKDADNIISDNQLKSAIDILKSWEIFRKVSTADYHESAASRNAPVNNN